MFSDFKFYQHVTIVSHYNVNEISKYFMRNKQYVCMRFTTIFVLKISLLVGSFFVIMFIMSRIDTKITIKPALRDIISASLIPPWAAFATVWSLGATSDYNSRLIFDEWVREVQRKYHHSLPFPEDGLVFDYR